MEGEGKMAVLVERSVLEREVGDREWMSALWRK